MKNLYWSSGEEILFIFTRCAFTGFYWVLLDYAGFFFQELGGFESVLLGFTEFRRISPHDVSLCFTRIFMGFTGFLLSLYRVLPGFADFVSLPAFIFGVDLKKIE